MILAIETSASNCSVALWENNIIILEYISDSPMMHAAFIGEYTEKILSDTSHNINLVAVAIGPGSFTGLRIGLSFAQGLCYGLNIPIVGISNHQILAAQVKSTDHKIYSVIDAHRKELYFARHKNNPLFEVEYHTIISMEELAEKLPENAQLACSETLNMDLNLKGIKITKVPFKASLLPGIAMSILNQKGPDNIETLEPLYIRPFAGIK